MSPAAATLLRLLRRYYDDRPLTAAEIAVALSVAQQGNRESRRRIVRFRATELRVAGHRVCGANDGYWLARDDREWAEYLDAVRRKARYRFVKARQMSQASHELATGQRRFF